RQRGYRRLSLETGCNEAFKPARDLYNRFGFEPCQPFAQYGNDPFSLCMTRAFSANVEPILAPEESVKTKA
ncbi:MAG: hypothetical protein ACTSY1_00895, partial [Alphaproteobacteria bacterium]